MKNKFFSIVTPSYNMLTYLKLCKSSIEDQNVAVEHIVVDGCSSDGTQEYLKKSTNLKTIIEKDRGMYDALNKGIKIANGDIIGHLNCDEQYLPGTLNYVKEVFNNNPEIDLVFGDYLAINIDGTLNAFKKAIPYRKNYILSGNLYIATCALFYRNRIFNDGNYFDNNYISAGDKEFIIRLHEMGYRSLYINKYFSCFTVTDNNLSQSGMYNHEDLKIKKKFLKVPQTIIRIFRVFKKIEKLFRGAYSENKYLTYCIFTAELEYRIKMSYKNTGFITKYSAK